MAVIDTTRTAGASRERLTAWFLRLLSLSVFLILWQWYGSQATTFAIAPVTDVARSLWEGIVTGSLLGPMLNTLRAFAVGYLIAAILGVSIGLFIGVSRAAANTLEPLVHAAYSMPSSLLIPILGIYTGFGFRGRVTLVVLWSVFEVLIPTTTGVREVPAALRETARAFGVRGWRYYQSIVLPSAAPYIAVGLRLAVGKAIRGAVTAEVLLAVTNLGSVLINAGSTFRVARLLATIVLIMLLGLVLMRGAEVLERKSLRWLD